MSAYFKRNCRACEQIERNKTKNQDRALALVERRAISRACILGVSKRQLLDEMHYSDLVEDVRAKLNGGVCPDCGHPFESEADLHFDHIEPPRTDHDWEREHISNIRLICACCNQAKGNKPFALYLKDREDTRISNKREGGGPTSDDGGGQGRLF